MRIIFQRALATKQFAVDCNPDVPLVTLFGDISTKTRMNASGDLAFFDGSRQLDIWRTLSEQNIKDGSVVTFGCGIRGAAGILPLNALSRDLDKLRDMLRKEHRGIQAAILYTEADGIHAFMEKFLREEMVFLSGTIVVYAPIDKLMESNHPEFLKWWDSEYRSLEFSDAIRRAMPFFCTPVDAAYSVLRAANIPEDSLPCILFFDAITGGIIVVKLAQPDKEHMLAQTLRYMFKIANKVNESTELGNIARLAKELDSFRHSAKKRGIDIPVTLLKIEFNVLSPKLPSATLFGALFGTDNKK